MSRSRPEPVAGAPAVSWALLGLAGVGLWWLTVGQARSMGIGPGTMGMSFAAFGGTWVAMMGAMMLPSISPIAVRASAAGAAPSSAVRASRAAAHAIAFLAPWAVFGALAYGALLGTQHLVDSSPGVAKWLGVGILAVAGLYQLSWWKEAAVRHCRMHGGGGGTARASAIAGLRHGAWCVGCCWALMSILVAVGVMNLPAMIALATLIFAEKRWRFGEITARLAGVAFLAFAVVAAVHPSILGGLHPSGMNAMHLSGM